MKRVPAILVGDFDGRESVVREGLARWSGLADSLEHVSDGASYTYRFIASGERRYLRLTPPGWRSVGEIDGELAFIDHLAAKAIAVARPIASLRSRRIESIESAIGTCIAVVFEEIDGAAADDDSWSEEQAREAGRLMARMHLAAYDFALPAGATRLSWRDELRGLDGELAASEHDLRAIVRETAELFERLPTKPEHYGMVHFDLSGDNVVWRRMEPGVIDFDDCMTHWYVADLARTVGYFRETARGRMGPYETAFMGGYRDVRRIEPEWLELLPVFLRLALISEFAWMTYASQATARGVRFTAEDAANLREIIRGLGGTTSV